MTFNILQGRSISGWSSINFFPSKCTKWSAVSCVLRRFYLEKQLLWKHRASKKKQRVVARARRLKRKILARWILTRRKLAFGDWLVVAEITFTRPFVLDVRKTPFRSYTDVSQGIQTAPSCKRNADEFISSRGKICLENIPGTSILMLRDKE